MCARQGRIRGFQEEFLQIAYEYIKQGKIDSGRYERFCKIYEELKEKDKYKY